MKCPNYLCSNTFLVILIQLNFESHWAREPLRPLSTTSELDHCGYWPKFCGTMILFFHIILYCCLHTSQWQRTLSETEVRKRGTRNLRVCFWPKPEALHPTDRHADLGSARPSRTCSQEPPACPGSGSARLQHPCTPGSGRAKGPFWSKQAPAAMSLVKGDRTYVHKKDTANGPRKSA